MMKKRAPGAMILKMVGVLLLVMGVFMAFGGAGTLALVMQGSSKELVNQYLTENHMTFARLVASGVISALAGVIYLAAGIIGVKYSNRPEKASQCIVMGIMMVAEIIVEVIYNITRGQLQLFPILSMLLLPALYIWGAFRNKQSQGLIV